MKNLPFDKEDLIIRFLAGETTLLENKHLSEWLAQSAENLSYFNSIRNIWLASSQISPLTMEANSQKINQTPPKNRELSGQDGQRNILNLILRVAAILLLAVVSGVVLYNQLSESNKLSPAVIAFEATLGSRAVATLPDGTKVWLNSGSKLVYDGNYNTESREVKLTGEAYFNVVTNPSKPFVVKTGKINIKALGTKFNVKAYPEDVSIVTTLEKGKVVIEGKDSRNREFMIEMKPKETVTYFKKEDGAIVHEINNTKNKNEEKLPETLGSDMSNTVTKTVQVKTELFTSWKDSRWVIEKQKLGDLARDLERRYNIKIHFTSDSIKKFHFSGSIENETIEQVMVILRHTIPLKYKIEKGIISIEQDNNLLMKFYR